MRIVLAGDVMIGRLVNQILRTENAIYPWGDTLDLLREADWRCCNLECVLSNIEPPAFRTPKVFRFRSDAKNVRVLEAASIDAVTLANNHTLDFEEDAFLQMLETLDSAGIAWAGAGRDLDEAMRPALSQAAGKRIALFSFTDNEPTWEATREGPGVLYLPIDVRDVRARKLFERVKFVKREVDATIVSVHWGSNWGSLPERGHQEMGRALIDAGADVVFGHSCHVLRGVEIYRHRPIFYSCGDFIDDYAVDAVERNDRSCLFSFELAPDGSLQRLCLHPTVIRRFQARRADNREAEEIAREMSHLSGQLGTSLKWRKESRILEWQKLLPQEIR